MKVFVLISVLLTVVVLAHSFDETRMGYPASFAFSLLTQPDFAVPETKIGNTQDISGPGERSRSKGFFPQFRVGRSDRLNVPSVSKKATKMTVFPRVGRDSPKLYTGSDCNDRHATRDTSTGLWFGPRLGVHKRDDFETPLSYILMNGGHGTRMEYIPYLTKDLDSEDDTGRSDFY